MSITPSRWNTDTIEDLVPVGSHHLYASVSGPARRAGQAVILIFPGSGASCDSWKPLASQIASSASVLLCDRAGVGRSHVAPHHHTGIQAAEELSTLLDIIQLDGPYVLVAHSYGGCIAREFLEIRLRDVAGVVLSETGTETKSRRSEGQYRQVILDRRPLSVIRGEAAFCGRDKAVGGPKPVSGDPTIGVQHEMLAAMAKMDEDLKREQLRLSRVSKFRNVPGCGHSLHLDCPDVVIEEIRWVLDNINPIALSGRASNPVITLCERMKSWLSCH